MRLIPSKDPFSLQQNGERDPSEAEFLLISLWESYEAIRAFAGEDIERAVYYSKDKEFLLELEPGVMHYEYESHEE